MSERLDKEAEVRQVFEMCRRRMSALQQMQVLAFKPGDTVSFTGRHGETLTGKVKKLNQKTASVEVPSGIPGVPQTWRVSPSLLRRAS
jgi:hypothetical protein